ncbi:MAG: hypothetical protein ABSA82_03300 [Thermacetogeniaceae bacterium]
MDIDPAMVIEAVTLPFNEFLASVGDCLTRRSYLCARFPGVPAGFQPRRSLEPAFRPGVSPDAEEEKRGH